MRKAILAVTIALLVANVSSAIQPKLGRWLVKGSGTHESWGDIVVSFALLISEPEYPYEWLIFEVYSEAWDGALISRVAWSVPAGMEKIEEWISYESFYLYIKGTVDSETTAHGAWQAYYSSDKELQGEGIWTAVYCAKGDVNANGKIESSDAILALRIAVGLMEPEPYQEYIADVSGDGMVRANDAILILRKAVGLAP